MAIPGITYRSEKLSSLTHKEMDDNFRSLIYSSSVEDGGDTLHLHFDTEAGTIDNHVIPLSGGTGGLAVANNANNRILTGTATPALIQGETSLLFDGTILSLVGRFNITDADLNTLIGDSAGSSVSGEKNTLLGKDSGVSISGNANIGIGNKTLTAATAASCNIAIGIESLGTFNSGNCNVSIGSNAGGKISSGNSNVVIGNLAGPTSTGAYSNQLYINNSESDAPLILGDFLTKQVTFNSQVSASIFSGSYYGDGSNLTGLTTAAEWDGTLDGNAQISGSLIVSGAAVTVDLTNTLSISGSIFSGSFVGDGSALTGIQASVFPFTGSAVISGSLEIEGLTTLSGSLKVTGPTDLFGSASIDKNITISNRHNHTNLAIGFTAGRAFNSSFGNNIALGYKTSQWNSTGRSSVTLGAYAGNGEKVEKSVYIGMQAGQYNRGVQNSFIGFQAGAMGGSPHYTEDGNATGGNNSSLGAYSLKDICEGANNTAIGAHTLTCLTNGRYNTALGQGALQLRNSSGNIFQCTSGNTGLGFQAGRNLNIGCGNIYIGHKAGPVSNTNQEDQLYINNSSGYPLIGGDFLEKTVSISGSLLVSHSVTAQSFTGDGSNLTGVTWGGSLNGNASITGSLTVSSSIVDFTDSIAISGSNFSGSFAGDGSNLTGISAEWDGTRNGDSQITGSLIVSGALNATNKITLSPNFVGTASPGVELIQFNSSSLSGTHIINSFALNGSTGYTGIKADYVLTNSSEDEKKVGTLLGSWDRAGNSTINDMHTIPTGDAVGTSFSIDASSNTAAILKVNAAGGSYELNMLITAFKRTV